jgi:hypothetical protein
MESSSRVVKLVPIHANELLPKAIRDESVNSYSPPIDSVTRGIVRGIPPDMTQALFPRIIGVGVSSPNFVEKVEEWYNELTIKVPADGRDFDMSVAEFPVDNGTGAMTRFPTNPEEYVIGSILLKDKNIAKSEEDIENGSFYRYKLVDLAQEKKRKEAETSLSIKSMAVVAKYSITDEYMAVVRQGLIINKVALDLSLSEINAMSNIEAKGALQLLHTKNPQLVLDTFENNDLLEDISIVHQLLESETLRLVGTDLYHIDDKIGNNIREAAMVIRNDSGFKQVLLSKHKNALELVE